MVAEEISDKLQNVKVSFPNWLVGVDLLVSRGEKRIGIQVNVSGYIDRKDLGREHIGCSFQQIGKERLDKSRGKVDFHVFLTRWPVHGKNEEHPFKYKFPIVPSSELEKRLTVKPALKGLYYLCFHFDENGKNVWDEGVWAPPTDPLTDYSQFLDAWELLNKALQ